MNFDDEDLLDFELNEIKKYIKEASDLENIDLTNNEVIDYDDLYEMYILDYKGDYNLYLDIKRNSPNILYNLDMLEPDVDMEKLIYFASLNPNQYVLNTLLLNTDYIPDEKYENTALYKLNTEYPESENVKFLYRYEPYIELLEMKRKNYHYIQYCIINEDYSFSIETCKILLIHLEDIMLTNLFKFIILETILNNEFFDEDIDFILRAISTENKEIIDAINKKEKNLLFNKEYLKVVKDFIEIVNGKKELYDNRFLLKYSPYKSIIKYIENNDILPEFRDRAMKKALIQGDIDSVNKLIKEDVGYPRALSYALHHDIVIPFCNVTDIDVLEYPNLLSVYHIQGNKFDYDKIKDDTRFLQDKYIDFLMNTSNEELEGFIELLYTENAKDTISYKWLASFARKEGLYELSDWLLNYKNKDVIFELIKQKLEEEVSEEIVSDSD